MTRPLFSLFREKLLVLHQNLPMKNISGLLLLLMVLTSCRNDTKELKTAFRKLSTEWDHTYAVVNEFVDQVEISQINWQEQYDRMELSAEEMEGFDEATLAVLREIKTTCREHGLTFDAVAEEVEAFAIRWEEQTAHLDDLDTRLEEGEKINDLGNQLSELRATLDTVPVRLENWSKRLEATYVDCQQNCRHFERLASGDDT